MENKFERIVAVNPAYDKRDTDPNKNYGIHSCDMFMVLKGEKGAVSFSLSTGWFLPETLPWKEECITKMGLGTSWEGHGTSVAYHSPTKMQDWDFHQEKCDWLGTECYGDAGFIISDMPYDLLIREGSEAVWKWLEDYYNQVFNNG